MSGTSLTLGAGEGNNFPDPAVWGEFSCTVWPVGDQPVSSNAEIVKVTARSGDVLTIERAAESTSAKPIDTDYQIAMTITSERLLTMSASEWFVVSQTTHGFSALDPIYHNGTNWQLAKSDAEATLATHIVGRALSADQFIAVRSGRIEVAAHGLTVGEYYYLDPAVAGNLTTTPSGSFQELILYVEDADTVHILGGGISGNFVTIDGTQTLTNKRLNSPKINENVALTATATELNALDGITSSTAELNILDGATLSVAELNLLDGVTATTTELNYVDTTVGTATASKAVVLDANKDFNFGTGDVTATIGRFNAMGGNLSGNTMSNGKFVVSVANDDVTVALKTAATGGDPSTSDPVIVSIAGTEYTVTSALSVTVDDSAANFNGGSAELATFEIDYFIYLGVHSGAIFIGFARIPYGIVYSDFSSTRNNEKYLAFSTTPSSTDRLSVFGRFPAILSSINDWTLPAGGIVISRPIYETRILTYQPQPSASGSMTYTSVTINTKLYQISGRTCCVWAQMTGTTGGTASTTIQFTAPIASSSSFASNIPLAGFTGDTGVAAGFCFIGAASSTISVRKYDASNWGLGASRQAAANAYYAI